MKTLIIFIMSSLLSLQSYSQLHTINPRLDPIAYDYKSPSGIIKEKIGFSKDEIDIYSSKSGVLKFEGTITGSNYNSRSYLDEVSPRINHEISNNPMIMTPEKAMRDYHQQQENRKLEGERAWKRVVQSWK